MSKKYMVNSIIRPFFQQLINIYIYIYIWPQEGWPSGKDPAHMLYYPLFEPWRVLGMGGGSTHALRLTASSVGVLG